MEPTSTHGGAPDYFSEIIVRCASSKGEAYSLRSACDSVKQQLIELKRETSFGSTMMCILLSIMFVVADVFKRDEEFTSEGQWLAVCFVLIPPKTLTKLSVTHMRNSSQKLEKRVFPQLQFEQAKK